ncbi:MAG: site-specific integrase [Rhodocyclaceae bacterium]|nr:site-specific integrase [Rhodocyclaceae bacterium]MBP6109234.1 site-specific integrase [Rhodocyclaceae bacterium]MBP6278704.1 site-specific integrase [Rhodocyclaceae bacterium]
MKTHDAENERIKRQYFIFLKEAKRNSEATVNAVAKALARFEADTKYRNFKKFHSQQAILFKRHLEAQTNQQTGERLSKATRHATLGHLKNFFQWLAVQPGYKSRLQYSDAEYFNLSEKDVRVATARRERTAPTMAQVKHVISVMPASTAIERRNRALIAFTLLTCARVGAIASLKLKHIDLVTGCIDQDAREVNTKFSKTFTTFFFRVGDEILQIVEEWVVYLREDMLWGNDDPLFPATRVVVGASQHFEADGLERAHWQSATAIRKIFRDAFVSAGLPYFNPHTFRSTIAGLGQSVCKTPEEFKAWSQNMGHEKVLTTFLNYGQVERARQGEIILGKGTTQPVMQADANQIADAVYKRLRDSGVDIRGR